MTTSPEEDRKLAEVQLESADKDAVKSGKDEIKTGKVEFAGEKFHVATKIGAMPMLEWAAASDMDTEDPAALAAILRMLEDVIHESEWKRFRALARKSKVEADELLDVINKAMEIITGTPTEEPDGSSGSATGTSEGSKAGASRRRAASST